MVPPTSRWQREAWPCSCRLGWTTLGWARPLHPGGACAPTGFVFSPYTQRWRNWMQKD